MSAPFFSPWEVLVELAPVMKELRKAYPPKSITNGTIQHPRMIQQQDGRWVQNPNIGQPLTGIEPNEVMEPIQEWWDMIQQCSWKVPFVHEAIVKQQKLKQAGGCCGVSDLCEILLWIDKLRPATMEKVENEEWRNNYLKKVHEPVCCLETIEEASNIMGMNTFPHITELPPWGVDGLPGFRYPNHRVPPLTRLVRPYEYRQPPNEGEDHEDTPFISYNVDGRSNVFGLWNTIGERISDSPLQYQALHSILCDEFGFQLDFSVEFSVQLSLPNLSVNFHRSVTLDECLSQYIPAPMFMPINELTSLTLGDGEEWGIFANFTLEASNFGTQFKVDTSMIAPLVKSTPFNKSFIASAKGKIGIDQKPAFW